MKGIFSKMVEIFQKIDIFYEIPNFKIFKQQVYKTKPGACVTLCVLAIVMAYVINLILIRADKSDPIIISDDQQVGSTSEFPLLPQNFTIAVSLADLNSNAFPASSIDTYFKISIQKCHRRRYLNSTNGNITVSLNCTTLPTETCTEKHFVSDVQKQFFSNIKLGTVQCINLESQQNSPPILQGQVNENEYQLVLIQLSACQNTTTSQKCASQELIEKKLLTGFYTVYLMDSLTQTQNPNQFFKQIIKNQVTSFSISTSKSLYQTYRILEANTDNGFLLPEIENQVSLTQQQYYEASTLYNNAFLIQHYLLLDSKSTVYSRKYINFLTFLSRIGGLWQILVLIFGIIIKPIIQSIMKIDIFNQIYQFKLNGQFKNYLNKNIMTNEQIWNQINNGNQNIISTTSNLIKSDAKQISFVKLKKNILSAFLLTFGCSKQFNIDLADAEQKFNQTIDILYIVEKLHEIDKLKSLLLNQNQKDLFELVQIPISDIDQLGYSKKKKMAKKLQQGYQGYQNIVKQRKKSQIDEKIIQNLNQDVLEIFNQSSQLNQFNSFVEQKIKINNEKNYDEQISSEIISPIPSPSHASKILVYKKNRNK